MDCIKINSNINLYYIPMTKLKTTTAGVYIHRELNEAEVSKNAILPYVLKRGCKLCPDSAEISKYLENLYGASFGAGVLKRGKDQIIYLTFETISDKYAPDNENLSDGVVKLMMSVLFEPSAFGDDVVGQEKNNAKDRIMAEINDKRQYALKRCTEEMCKGDSFALPRLGTKEGIDAVSADILKKHYESIITSSAIDIYICGDADVKAIADEIKSYTGKIAFSSSSIPKSEIFVKKGDIKNVTDKMDVVQGKLCMGFSTGVKPDSGDYAKLMVMNSIFGAGAHSKLFNNVREKLSLCYYASSNLIQNKGIMLVNAGIEFKNFQKAHDEILLQLDAIRKCEISELEFTSSVNAILNELESYRDNQVLMQMFCLTQKISGTDYTIDDMKDMIKRVTPEDAAAAAKNIELDTVYFLTGKEKA